MAIGKAFFHEWKKNSERCLAARMHRASQRRDRETAASGRYDGKINPQAYSISRQVNLSDLNLSCGADRAELHAPIYEMASTLCAELDARVPGPSGDRDTERECIRQATRNAMRDVVGRSPDASGYFAEPHLVISEVPEEWRKHAGEASGTRAGCAGLAPEEN